MRLLQMTALAFAMTLAVAATGRAEGTRVARAAGGQAGERDLARENEQLRAENRALRERLRQLEEARRPPAPAPRPPATAPQQRRFRVVPVPPPQGDVRRVPENWVPREINGLRFYIIPLAPRVI